MDAIECGIVKLPRVPSPITSLAEHPVYRKLWEHVGKDLLRTSDALDIPAMLQTALYALYSNYEAYHRAWEAGGVDVPGVPSIVCQNTKSPA